jgi:hypothetical protein
MYGHGVGMKSFYLSLKWKYQCKMSVCTNVTEEEVSVISLVSVHRIQSSKSVRPYGGPEPKKRDGKTQQTEKQNKQNHTDPIEVCDITGKKFVQWTTVARFLNLT